MDEFSFQVNNSCYEILCRVNDLIQQKVNYLEHIIFRNKSFFFFLWQLQYQLLLLFSEKHFPLIFSSCWLPQVETVFIDFSSFWCQHLLLHFVSLRSRGSSMSERIALNDIYCFLQSFYWLFSCIFMHYCRVIVVGWETPLFYTFELLNSSFYLFSWFFLHRISMLALCRCI